MEYQPIHPFPTIVVPCFNHGSDVTHARLTYYPHAMLIQYGLLDEGFDLQDVEILPIRVYPELTTLHNGERWLLSEVLSMFDMADVEAETAAVS